MKRGGSGDSFLPQLFDDLVRLTDGSTQRDVAVCQQSPKVLGDPPQMPVRSRRRRQDRQTAPNVPAGCPADDSRPPHLSLQSLCLGNTNSIILRLFFVINYDRN